MLSFNGQKSHQNKNKQAQVYNTRQNIFVPFLPRDIEPARKLDMVINKIYQSVPLSQSV